MDRQQAMVTQKKKERERAVAETKVHEDEVDRASIRDGSKYRVWYFALGAAGVLLAVFIWIFST